MNTEFVNEYESLKNQAYNLNLYIDYLAENHPDVYAELMEHFEGMPGHFDTKRC